MIDLEDEEIKNILIEKLGCCLECNDCDIADSCLIAHQIRKITGGDK